MGGHRGGYKSCGDVWSAGKNVVTFSRPELSSVFLNYPLVSRLTRRVAPMREQRVSAPRLESVEARRGCCEQLLAQQYTHCASAGAQSDHDSMISKRPVS